MKLVRLFYEDKGHITLIAEFYVSETGNAYCTVSEYDKDGKMISQELVPVSVNMDKQLTTWKWEE